MQKVVLVTGASRGIGAAIARRFGAAGYSVAINYKSSKKEAEAVAAQIEKAGGQAALFACDITNFDAAKKMIADVAAHFGRIDVLVNNAGISSVKKPLNEKTVQEWQRVLNINLIAPFILSTEAARYMEKNKRGAIVNISSTNAILHGCNSCEYDASKAALNTLTDNLAMFYQPYIRVNSVSPGYIKTDMTAHKSEAEFKDNYVGRVAQPADVADVVYFLANDDARHVNGTDIIVNGGGTN